MEEQKLSSLVNMERAAAVLLAVLSAGYAQQRWYYTGNFQNHEITAERFAGTTFSQEDLFDVIRPKHLIYGGLASRAQASNTSNSTALIDTLQNDLLAFGNGSMIRNVDSVDYPLHITKNYGRYSDLSSGNETEDFEVLKFKGEVGLYDHQRRVFLEKYWRDITIGELKVVKFVKATAGVTERDTSTPAVAVVESNQVLEVDISAAGDVVVSQGAETTVDDAIVDLTSSQAIPSSDATGDARLVPSAESAASLSGGAVHQVAFTTDLHGRSTLYSHTWSVPEDNTPQAAVEKTVEDAAVKDVRVMSYNLWHNNPPSWVYHHPRERWERYNRRLSHFADVVVAEDPDVIALQEVRLDGSFVAPTPGTLRHWRDLSAVKVDGGNQAEHVLSHLAQARRRAAQDAGHAQEGSEDSNGGYYQFVFQPAMSMIDNQKLSLRNEEGVMILSKFPIIDYQVMLLPRAMTDPSDDHQRAVLNVKVRIPSHRVHRSAESVANAEDAAEGDEVTMDVMTSHFSLSERARNEGVHALIGHISPTAASTGYAPSPVQVLTGDFNAEPHEQSIKYLLGTADAAEGMLLDDHVPFVDAWEFTRRRAVREIAAQGVTAQESKEIAEGFTFPACSPVKRIDFILVRNNTNAGGTSSTVCDSDAEGGVVEASARVTAEIVDFRVVGTRPSADTEHLVGSREGLGMNDKDSPLWASDHFAVVSDLRIVQASCKE